MAEPVQCIYCGARTVEVTCSGDPAPRYLCTGSPSHEFSAIDFPPAPDEESEPEPKRSLIERLFGRK